MDNQPKATVGYIVTVGFAIFATYFGAGNLIFPPRLGFDAGTLWLVALAGFVLADAGLAIFGIIATANVGGGVDDMGKPVGHWFSLILGALISLCIGPLFCIPRTASTTFEFAIVPHMAWFPKVAFIVLYFAVTIYLTLSQTKVVDVIGKFLTPVLLIALAIIIGVGIVHPLGHPATTGALGQFQSGLVDGYQTMDGIGSLVMAGIFVFDIRQRGFGTVKEQVRIIIPAGIIAAICMAVVYGGLAYIGATASGGDPAVFTKSLSRVDLLLKSVNQLLGGFGLAALGLAVALACLTTSIGLTSMVANFFSQISRGRLSYKALVWIICVFSCGMGMLTVDQIVNLAINVLLVIYPMVVALIVMTIFRRWIPETLTWAYRGAIAAAGLVSFADVLCKGIPSVAGLIASLPLAGAGLGWVTPALVCGVLGALVQKWCEPTNAAA